MYKCHFLKEKYTIIDNNKSCFANPEFLRIYLEDKFWHMTDCTYFKCLSLCSLPVSMLKLKMNLK